MNSTIPARPQMARAIACALAAVLAPFASNPAAGQTHLPGKVEIPFNRYYTYAEIEEWLKKIATAYPEIV